MSEQQNPLHKCSIKNFCFECSNYLTQNTYCEHAQFTHTAKIIKIPQKNFLGSHSKDIIKEEITSKLVCKCGFTSYCLAKNKNHVYHNYPCLAHIHKCDLSSFSVIDLNKTIDFEKWLGYSIQHSCNYCNKTGQLKTSSFAPCENCMGMGGQICLDCNGTKILIRKNEYDIHDRTIVCGCKTGYSQICYVCNGSRAKVTKEIQINCTKCRIKEKKQIFTTIEDQQSSLNDEGL
jgi:hypothetical protein